MYVGSPTTQTVTPHTEAFFQERKKEGQKGVYMEQRFYSFKCVTYVEEGKLKEFLKHKDISHWCYILHDKDVKEGGELKEAHRHLLVTVKQQKSFNAFRKLFADEQNTLVKPIEDFQHDFRYLTHKDDPDKYQYSEKDIVTDGTDYWSKISKSEDVDNGNEAFLNDLCNPSLSMREMALRYGRDYMKNFKAYHYFAEMMLKDEATRGNMNVEDMQEVNMLDLKMRYTNPEYIKPIDNTIYDYEQWKKR